MTDERSHLTLSKTDGVTVVQFTDPNILDELAISEIGDELFGLVDETPPIHLLVSFKNVEHLSSAALGMLITLKNKVDKRSGTLKLSDITSQIFEVFRITQLNKLFQIYDTTEQALKAF